MTTPNPKLALADELEAIPVASGPLDQFVVNGDLRDRILLALRSDPQSVRRQVIEECARLADITAARAAFNSDNAPEQPERYYLAEEVRKAVAEAIRSLGSVPGEDGDG